MRYVQFCFFLFMLTITTSGLATQQQPIVFPEISSSAQISLITGEPGKLLYERFGHSAVRVYDPSEGIDLVYNYGTFDFDTPGFYMKFLRGKLKYSLAVYGFRNMVRSYEYRNLSLYEQVLNLTFEEKKTVYAYLNNNYQPANRYYLYDFFFDNCSSRIRDVFEDVLGPRLIFHDDHIRHHKTFRQLLDEFIDEQTPWGDFGIDLILGIPTDATATSYEYMFLPYKLYNAFEHAEIQVDTARIPFVQTTKTIYESVGVPDQGGIQLTPSFLFWTLLMVFIVISLTGNTIPVITRLADAILFLAIGLGGLLIAFLWFGTDHIATKDNLNLLWAFPGHLIMVYVVIAKPGKQWIRYYALFWLFFLILFLGSWSILPQQMHMANIPIILTLTLRFYFYYRYNNAYVERKR